MSFCGSCGKQLEDGAKFCPYCGATSQTSAPVAEEVPAQQPAYQTFNAAPVPAVEMPVHENVLAGTVGAFLFSLIGVLLYFLLYQVNIIAGISGLVIFVLAQFGYRLFCGNKKSVSNASLIVSSLLMLAMILLAEFICLANEIYKAFGDYGASFFDCFRAIPDFLGDSEIAGAVASDLVWAYLFGIAATVGTIVTTVKARKKNVQQ